jgi:hypothetical protein
MSEVKVNKISPRSGTGVTLGDNGDTFTVPSGATLDIASGGTIDATGATITGFDAASDEKVKISSNDTTPGFLNGKLVAGTNISLTEGNDGSNETLTIAAAPSTWLTKTGAYTALDQDRIFVDTSGGAVTITLPASPTVGDQVNFVDSKYTFDSNALTVGRNSSKIANTTADLVVNTEGAAFGLVFSGADVGWTYTEK